MSELKSSDSRICPECGGPNLHHTLTASAGPYGPALLRGLGSLFHTPKFQVVVCADCGLTRFYAEPSARANLTGSSRWLRR
jgi:predicted nucleic-acid-binding Zn-ribbon protein